MKSVEELLSGGSAAWKFENYGDSRTGVITHFEAQQQTDFDDNSPKFFADGSAMMQIVIDLDTQDRDDPDDDGKRRAYVKSNMLKGLQKALRDAKVKSIEVGGRLTVTYTGDGERTAGKKGYPPKLYTVQYVPPQAAGVEQVLSGGQPPVQQYTQQPPAQPAQQQYMQQPPAQPVQQYAQQPPAPVQQAPVQQVSTFVPGSPEYEAKANDLRSLGISEQEIQQALAKLAQ
ncbi:MAG: hypothetical protein WC054_02650 [Candidatus Nanopelagicales bacterium]